MPCLTEWVLISTALHLGEVILRSLYEAYGVTLPGHVEDEITTRRSIIHYLINIGKVKTIVPDLGDISGVQDRNLVGYNLAIQSLASVVSGQQQKIEDLEDKLSNINTNWFHRLILQLRKTKRKMFPPGSRGAYILGKYFKFFKAD